jgi:transcriptional regulator with XRE-family HTH domain
VPPIREPNTLLRQVTAIIDAAREAQGLTQNELGKLSGISQSTVSKYFRMALILNLAQFDALCSALGLDPGSVMVEAQARRSAL